METTLLLKMHWEIKDPTRVSAEVGGAEPVACPLWAHLRVIGLSEGVASAEWRGALSLG